MYNNTKDAFKFGNFFKKWENQIACIKNTFKFTVIGKTKLFYKKSFKNEKFIKKYKVY